tara:strand:+ start:1565 stop:2287 length:723 start_codon:yes stop_codon:yes gene_type:complete
MKQLNLIPVNDFISKNLGWIVAVLLLIMMYECNNKNNSLVIKDRENQNKEFAKKRDSLIAINKDKDKIINDNNRIIEKAINDIVDLEIKNKDLYNKAVALRASTLKFNLNDWKKYFQEKTGSTDKDVYIQGDGITMTRKPLVSIANLLIKADVAIATLNNTKEMLSKTKIISSKHERNYLIEKDKNNNLSLALEEDENIIKNLNSNVSDLKQDLKKASRPKLIPILIGALIGVTTGILIK